jgi:cobalt-zinc-cadmium efflux system membrane fusion protein
MRVLAQHPRLHPLALAVLLAIGCGGAERTDEAPDAAGAAITQWSDSTELFMEHPALVVGVAGKFNVHLTDLTDFAPLRSGRVTLRFTPRGGGEPVVVAQSEPRAPGIYGPAPVFARAGTYDLEITVESPQARDRIVVEGLEVYAAEAAAPRETEGEAGGIPFLKEQQWKSPGFASAFVSEDEIASAVVATGVLEPAADRYAQVSAPVAGLLDAASLRRAPVPGQRVEAGMVLAVLNPSLGEGGGASIADARARLREAQDEFDRATRLYAQEAVPQRRVHEAEINLAAAREALMGYDGGAGGLSVRAPIGGVVVDRSATAGSRVEAGVVMFTILDPRVLWLRVHVPSAAVSTTATVGARAEFWLEGSAERRTASRLVSVGAAIDELSRTVPVLFEVPNPDGAMKAGANARVALRGARPVRGLVVPLSAVLEEDGTPIVYVQRDGESFERRVVRLGAQDGVRALVVDGLRAGERIVTGGAYQVRLASLSTSAPTHGHEH